MIYRYKMSSLGWPGPFLLGLVGRANLSADQSIGWAGSGWKGKPQPMVLSMGNGHFIFSGLWAGLLG